MSIVKVAFLLNLSENWLGGVNYYRSLISAIMENKDLNVEPVIFIAKGSNKNLLDDYPKVTIVESSLFTRFTFYWLIRKVIYKMIGKDILLEQLFKRYDITVISHLEFALPHSNIATIAWIPDFQHCHLPELFSTEEINARNKTFLDLGKMCDTVIVSSYDAKKDFLKFSTAYKNKSEVLQFVVPVNNENIEYSADLIKKKYGINKKFFYLPNQYWVHKNHKIVLAALNILKQQHKNVLVVSSGNTGDYRNDEYFSSLIEYIKEKRLEESFKILGKIPYQDVKILSEECLAFINPSLFEGWSTTVEEAKSIGKRIVLSDIAVHREQDPQGGYFFDRNDANSLAQVMWNVWNLDQDDFELREKAKDDLLLRRKIFAETYKNIVNNTLKRFQGDK